MKNKLKLIVYYLIISHLPHSRLLMFANKFRLWYCSRILKIISPDPNSKFEPRIYISDAKDLQIGKHCRINENVFFQGKISIGNYVMIAPNVAFHSSTHIYGDTSKPMVTYGLTESEKIIVEDDVWIARNVVILPGVRIGRGSIIGANAVVSKDVAPYSIMGGVPAKLIRKRK